MDNASNNTKCMEAMEAELVRLRIPFKKHERHIR